ncbi:MAG: 23S rRNA (guanosine(2251)-2'-O)-methyltransferase RlmB [Bdellovibrionales bacterium]|nr:23S rRNA (guanosine(2251)-2'-O)-methyltransferase RlmB [Bdellovibrionales bacterium]
MRKFKKPSGGRSAPQRGGPSRSSQPNPRGRDTLPQGRVVVGIHAVCELLKVRPRSVLQLWLKSPEGNPELTNIADQCERLRIRPMIQSPGVLDRITPSHQGVVAFSSETPELSLAALKKLDKATLIVLDEVEDPHNLGAVLRTAWLFGAEGVLTPETRAASLTATVSKVAQGAVEHVPVMQESGLLETLKHLKSEGFWMFGLSHKGDSAIFKTDIPDKVIWVLGSESAGIRKPIERECDQLVAIPQADPEASFNVSVAAAIALAETFRQRQI